MRRASPIVSVALLAFAVVLLVACGNDDDGNANNTGGLLKKAGETVKESVKETASGASELAEKATEKGSELASGIAEKTKEAANKATETVSEVADSAAKTASGAASAVTDAASDTAKSTSAETVTPEPEKVVEKPAPSAPKGAHGAVVTFFSALHRGDADAAVAVVDGSPEQKQALAARAAYQNAGLKFRKAFVARFGEKAWRTFNDPEHTPEPPNGTRPPFNARLSIFEQKDVDQMLLYKPQINGDEAVYPAETGDLRVVRKDNQWRLDASTLLPEGTDGASKAIQVLSASAKHVNRFIPALGYKDISADDLDIELGRALVETLYGFSSQEEHRFDVSKLK